MNNKKASIYELDGIPSLKEAIPAGVQHVFAMFAGNITPIIVVGGILKLPADEMTFLIQAAMVVSGIASLIQVYPIPTPFGKIGAKMPIVMGTSAAFISTASVIGMKYGIEGILGASLVGGFIQLIFGKSLKYLAKFFPPVVTGTVLLAIGINLMPIGINYFAGGQGAENFGSLQNLIMATFVLILIIVLKEFGKGAVSSSAILIALVIGYIVAIPLGMVDFSSVREATPIAVPLPFKFNFTFHVDAIISMTIMYIISGLETLGNVTGIASGGLKRNATAEEMSGGVMADALGSILAAIFGLLPNTAFGQNVGIITMTGVVNRFVVTIGSIFLIVAGIIPGFGALIAAMPSAVLGGAIVLMFAGIAMAGINMLTMNDGLKGRNATIVSAALALGIGLSSIPAVTETFTGVFKVLFGESSVVTSGVIAIILNLILPKEAVKAEEKSVDIEELEETRLEA